MTAVLTLTMNPALDLSAAADRVEPERKIRCRDARRDPGGGGINVARVLRRLGTDCRALYPAGGPTGSLLHDLLDAEGVVSLPLAIAGDTREDVTVLETASGAEYRFVLPGPVLAAAEWQAVLDRLAALEPRPDYLVASGSLPPGVPDDFYARVADAAAALGARAVIDTSGPALAAALGRGVYLVKPNLRELAGLTGRPLETEADWTAAAAGLVATGAAEVVALTLGHRGAMLVAEGVRLRAPAIEMKPASTVGAGDSFLAGMVWRLAAGADLADAFGHGIAAGAAALMAPGTGLCRPADIERLYPQVRLSGAG